MKSGNQEYPRLSFAKYLETRASKKYQIWHERFYCKVTECCKIPGLQLESELLRENQLGGKTTLPLPHPD